MKFFLLLIIACVIATIGVIQRSTAEDIFAAKTRHETFSHAGGRTTNAIHKTSALQHHQPSTKTTGDWCCGE